MDFIFVQAIGALLDYDMWSFVDTNLFQRAEEFTEYGCRGFVDPSVALGL